MTNIVQQARRELPFHLSFDGHCEGRCQECPFKLLDFLDMGLSHWESRLARGDVPSLGDVHALGRECQEVYDILRQQGLVGEPETILEPPCG